MKCSKCDKDVDSCCGWPIGWVWMQTEQFAPCGISTTEINKNKPYYLLCSDCKKEIFSGMQAYKTVIKREVIPA